MRLVKLWSGMATTTTISGPSSFEALTWSNHKTGFFFLTGVLAWREKKIIRLRKTLPAENRTNRASSRSSIATNVSTTTSSRKTWIMWRVRRELHIRNLNDVGNAHS